MQEQGQEYEEEEESSRQRNSIMRNTSASSNCYSNSTLSRTVTASTPRSITKRVIGLLQRLSESLYDGPFIALLCLFEIILCLAIIHWIAYTEIDWIAYMQEVQGWWVDGQHDYRLLKGDTGPLVYPAGFLYVFTFLRHLTDDGTNIRTAQYCFAALYVIQALLVWYIYQNVLSCQRKRQRRQKRTASTSTTAATLVWSWRLAMAITCLSKRLHSIFVLRLFNDGIAMLFLYASISLFLNNYWKWGCLCFSFGVSIKMNVLLFAPGLLLLLLQSQSTFWWSGTFSCLSICAVSQVLLGAPFLLTHPVSYLRKAFELDRTFFYEWTVNLKVSPILSAIGVCVRACLFYLYTLLIIEVCMHSPTQFPSPLFLISRVVPSRRRVSQQTRCLVIAGTAPWDSGLLLRQMAPNPQTKIDATKSASTIIIPKTFFSGQTIVCRLRGLYHASFQLCWYRLCQNTALSILLVVFPCRAPPIMDLPDISPRRSNGCVGRH